MNTKIGLNSVILLTINSIIGSGLFFIPSQVFAIAGPWSLAVFLLVALIIISIGWCFAKCASLYTRNGGAYVYAKEAFGDFVGFQVGIMRCGVGIIAWATLAVGFATALGVICPYLAQPMAKKMLIVSLISMLGILNLFGVNAIKNLNNIITFAKVIPLIILIGLGIFYVDFSNIKAISSAPLELGSLGPAALILFFAFSGFESIPVAAGEMDNPKRNIPVAIITGILLCSVIYFSLQLICIGVLGPDLATATAPLSQIGEKLWGVWGKAVISTAMLISIGGVTIVCSFITPRSLTALAEDSVISPKLNDKNRFGSPYLAIILSTLLTIGVALSGTFIQLITISVISRFMQHIVVSLALFSFEKKGLMQPFDKPWKRLIPFFGLCGIAWLACHAEIYQLLLGFGALFVGIPLYYLKRYHVYKVRKANGILT